MKIDLKTLLMVSTGLCMLPAAALAQTAASQDKAAADATTENAEGGVQDIIVTATRRATNLQSVTATVEVASAAKLDALNVQDSQGLEVIVPGVTIARSGGVTPFIRGIGTFNAGFSEASVAQYIDGVYLPNSAGSLFSFNNIERIEVLKGPQGTLYGRNTTGGLINVITRDPGAEFKADGSLGYSNYDTFTQSAYVSAPLASNVAGNIAVFHEKQGKGWSQNLFTGNDVQKSEETGVYGKLRWTGDATRITLSGLYNFSNSSKGWAFAVAPGTRGLDGTPYLGEYRISQRVDPGAKFRSYMGSLRIDHEFGFADFFSLTAYQYGRQSSRLSQNGIAGNPVNGQSSQDVLIDFNYNTLSQEFQLSSKDKGPLEWVVGAFYYHDNTNVQTALLTTCVGAVCAPAAGGVPRLTHTRPTTRSYSGYADGTYSLTDSTRVTVGLRYTYEEKAFSGFSEPYLGLPNSVPAAPIVTTPATLDLHKTYPKLTYRAVLAQDFTDNFRGYISYNRGFKSGNYNPNNLTNPAVRPEILDAFEAGIKSELFDRKLRFNLAGFYYDYKDVQVRSIAGPPGTPNISQNVAAARAKGIDGQIDFVPVNGLTLSGGFEYLDAYYRDYPGAVCAAVRPTPYPAGVLGGGIAANCTAANASNLAGNALPISPKWSGNLTLTYVMNTGIGSFTWVANDNYKSRFTFTPDNTVSQTGYHMTAASLTWAAPDKTYDVRLFVNNLFDKYRYVAGQGSTQGFVYVPGEPRTYGITVGAHF